MRFVDFGDRFGDEQPAVGREAHEDRIDKAAVLDAASRGAVAHRCLLDVRATLVSRRRRELRSRACACSDASATRVVALARGVHALGAASAAFSLECYVAGTPSSRQSCRDRNAERRLLKVATRAFR